ncbi:MAG: sigma-70 family RNA polymerase sigma factor [bacterium]|nr:sigma-70 family RNA polymerase sigma factor [bacterium]
MDDEERDLIRRAQHGEGWAFEQLVRRYDRPILALARDMVGNVSDAQDVYQGALLAAFLGLPRFRMDSDFSTWLYRIAVNKALRFRRQRQRRRTQYEASAAAPPPPGAAVADRQVLDVELRQQLDLALAELSGQERLAFTLCHRQGLRIDRAAELMECSAGSVKSYLFRGRDKVRKALGAYMES